MVDIVHRIGIRSPAARVSDAVGSIEGLAGWWTEEVRGDSALGGQIEFVFRGEDGAVKGTMVMEVQPPENGEQVRWRCVAGPEEWIGTEVTYELSQQDDQTILLFGHRNWREAVEFTYHCSMKWATFLLSLRDYVETGSGRPSPRDLKIDNWN